MSNRKTAHWKVWGYSYTCSECGYAGAMGPEKYCANCGAEMSEPIESWWPHISDFKMPDTYICEKCGTKMIGIKKYCPNCGSKFVKMLEYKDGKNKCSYCIFEDNCIERFLNREQPDCTIFKPKIVRCKDCKYMTEQYDIDGSVPYWTCSEWDSGTDFDGYCYYGERKDEVGNA